MIISVLLPVYELKISEANGDNVCRVRARILARTK